MRCRRWQRSRQTGFTLIELITCMVILGILAATVGPRLLDNRAVHARGFADDLANSLRYAQRVAIASNCEVRVRITAVGYSGFQRAPAANTCSAAGAWNQPVLRIDDTTLAAASPAGVNANPNRTIVFQTDGRPAGGATNINVGARIITVDGATGRVSVR
jgi:MSHA pilin protein MshC